MSNQLQPTNPQGRAVVDPSKLFDFFQDFAKDRKIKREKTVLDEDGNPAIKEVELTLHSKNALRNPGITEKEFAALSTMIQPEDKKRIAAIIKADQFEIVKAFQACFARDAALDENLVPKSWSDAERYETSSLATLAKYKGRAKAVAVVQAVVTLFTDNFGTKNQMDAKAIKRVASEIVRSYHSLTIADLKFIFGAVSRMAPEGLKKRRFSFSVDAQQILELIEDSVKDKREDVEKRMIDDHVGNFSVEARYRPERRGQPDYVQLSQEEIDLRNEQFAQAKEIAREKAAKLED